MRISEIKRKTKETDVRVKVDLDRYSESAIDSGSGFFNHMLTLFAKFAKIGLEVGCAGDVEVDFHHSAEDIGIAMGEAFAEALGKRHSSLRSMPDADGRGFGNGRPRFFGQSVS